MAMGLVFPLGGDVNVLKDTKVQLAANVHADGLATFQKVHAFGCPLLLVRKSSSSA